MSPLVSILIPAHNAEAWIADTLKSAIGQTWARKEVIVVDDGSTDHTLAIARQFASKDVLVATQKNQGAAATRNKAFSLCQGAYLQWLDADDLLSPDKVGKQMEALDHYPGKRTLLSAAWGQFIYRAHKAKFIPTPLWCDLAPVEWLLRKMGQNLHMQTATWLVSRELTEAAGPWDTRLLGDDDGEYFCRVLLASEGTRFVPEAKVFYRISGSHRLSHIGRSDRKMEAQFTSMQLHCRYLRTLEDSDRVRAVCVQYLQTWLPNFYPERLDLFEQAQDLAASMGGKLDTPRLPWKYAWIKALAGWKAAKEAQLRYNSLKLSVKRFWDKTLFQMERRDLEKTTRAPLPSKAHVPS